MRRGAKENEVGGELTSNPIVRKLTFTGSTEVGKLLMQQCAVHRLRRRRYRGRVKGAIASKYRNAGQTCVCANRILV